MDQQSNAQEVERLTQISTISGDLALGPLITCKLCFGEYQLTDLHQMEGCSCVYCLSCLKQYLGLLIQEGVVTNITCPDASCKESGKIQAAEIQKVVGENIYERYKRVRFQLEIDLDPNRTYCPELGCETICHVCHAGGDPTKAKPVHCPSCGLTFCCICKSKWHANVSCSENLANLAQEQGASATHLLDVLSVRYDGDGDAKIKHCPMCHIPIERDAGCAQMMCKRCKHVFCWYCLANLDDDFLLRHYDKGPCKNKLGHSRASVIWHRTQVIGIFAGFGILLLLASPFLLLIAPCILCCKCNLCHCRDEEDNLPTWCPPPTSRVGGPHHLVLGIIHVIASLACVGLFILLASPLLLLVVPCIFCSNGCGDADEDEDMD